MSQSQSELPSDFVIRRLQATDIDYLKFLVMPRSLYAMPSWMSIRFMTTLFEIETRISVAIISQVFILGAMAIVYPFMRLLGVIIFVDTFSTIIVLISYSLLVFALTAITPGWDRKDFRYWWVIEQDNRFIGYARLQSYETFSVINFLHICPNWRGQGLGTTLTKKLIQASQKPIYLSTFSNTVKFYRRLGFRIVRFQKLSTKVKKLMLPNFIIMAHY
ncbi:GNAT family N-acetyltransferase [Acaryochloris sp. IP29b_bin.148]|uniref:GNAT family N-acetyltransferase n=1 Tax=Acaryochloris sp. IP29b_bin.148 TaxID=2969218 RepID=UPI00261327ED|nr:GNAT family N-acetyltransferase [Acaryochloris sp. IP29b_bin.148]